MSCASFVHYENSKFHIDDTNNDIRSIISFLYKDRDKLVMYRLPDSDGISL